MAQAAIARSMANFAARSLARARTNFNCVVPKRTLFGVRPAVARSQRLFNLTRVAAIRASAYSYEAVPKGDRQTMEFRIFFQEGGKPISPWHDIPLFVEGSTDTLNFICEIPKESKAKMEVATDEPSTPIKQDTKKGKLRDYPYNINWNYGLLPQTWEDPGHKNEATGCLGDNDPMDVVEIGSTTCEMGGVYPVKPLGVYAMIDEGEIDWKLITLRADDPKAASVETLEDVEREFPGELTKIREWFRDYKVPDGKPQNSFGLDDKCMPKDYAMDIVNETHSFYKALKSGETPNSKELSLS